MSSAILSTLLLVVVFHHSSATYAPYPPTGYVVRTPYPAGSVAVYPVPTTVNTPSGSSILYPAGANVVYNAPTVVNYPQQTRCYYPQRPAVYPPNSTVSYPPGASVVYPPGTELIMLDNTTSTVQPINGSPYGIVSYPNATNCTYYNNPRPPTYYPPGTPMSTYYVPGGSTIFGPCPPPVGYTQYYYNPYNQPFYRTCSGYNGATGGALYNGGPYYGPMPVIG